VVLPHKIGGGVFVSCRTYICVRAHWLCPSRNELTILTAYVFWSLFTALIPTLFYFSVWQLSIAGSELALFSVVSPVLLSLAIPSSSSTPRNFLDIAKSRHGQVILQTISLLGIAAYIVPSPLGRLLLVSVGTIAGMMRQAPLWAGVVEDQGHVGYQAIGMSSMDPMLSC
jgi:hypothetical protein